MLVHPGFSPIAFQIWKIKVHWYGIMYLLGFAAAWWIGMRRAAYQHSPVKKHQIEDILFYCVIGVVVGGRLGHVFFYSFDDWLRDPLWPIKVWEGGMSFHGGILGVCVAMWLYARNHRLHFLALMDFVAPSVPLGLGFGRIGNFINQELWGRETTVAWGMQFPNDTLGLVRHPSQLYEATLEGFLMFVIIYWYARKPQPLGAVCSLFVFLYGCARFTVEFTREPDVGIDLVFGWLSRGQLLSLPMIAIGMGVFIWTYGRSARRSNRY